MKRFLVTLVAAVTVAGLPTLAWSSTITDGFTYAVASSGGSTGSHFHSNTGGAFGNPAGKAEVGRFRLEEVRGLSEYNLTGLTPSSSAFVTFDVYKAGGLFVGDNDFPFTGTITVKAYAGNNREDIFDWQAPSIATVGKFSTTPLFVGGVLSFDITSTFNASVAAGISSLGIRLRADPLNSSGAWTFDTFHLTADNQTTIPGVPEPATYALMIAGFGVITALTRRRGHSSGSHPLNQQTPQNNRPAS